MYWIIYCDDVPFTIVQVTYIRQTEYSAIPTFRTRKEAKAFVKEAQEDGMLNKNNVRVGRVGL